MHLTVGKWAVSSKNLICSSLFTIGVLVVVTQGAIQKRAFEEVHVRDAAGVLHRHKRVVGGTAYPNVSFPAYAPITRGTDNRDWICSSTVISQRWVLTSAQCMDTWNAHHYYVWPKYLESGNKSIRVAQVVKYPKYSMHDKNRANDLMLLRLEEDIGSSVWGLLAANGSTPADTEKWYTGKAIVVGYGKTDQSVETILLFGEVPFLPTPDCNTVYNGTFNLTENIQACTGDLDLGGISPCGSDAGGSLFKITDGAQITIGISTLVGPGPCGAVDMPAVYTKVAPYIDWIKKYVPDLRTTDDPFKALDEPMQTLLKGDFKLVEPPEAGKAESTGDNEIPQE